MSELLWAIFQRRAVKVFDPAEIPRCLRGRLLDAAPTSLGANRSLWRKASRSILLGIHVAYLTGDLTHEYSIQPNWRHGIQIKIGKF
jgi:hypothetical protein